MNEVLKLLIIACLLAVPCLALYVDYSFVYPYVTGRNFWFRIFVEFAFAGWIILAINDSKYLPKVSGIVVTFALLLIVMFFANLFGAHPASSFWGNLERMDGYTSLFHTFMLMLVLSSIFQTQKSWHWFLDFSLAIGVLVAFYGLAQSFELVETENYRINSTLGNAAYMAVYMLFHTFFALWRFLESKAFLEKIGYAALIAVFTFALIETGTRGTFIGLSIGVAVILVISSIFFTQLSDYKKYLYGAAIIFCVIGISFSINNSLDSVDKISSADRISQMSPDSLKERNFLWGMALDGVKSHPILGYGQNNFIYAYHEFYNPDFYYKIEKSADRAHNFILEWLVSGGILGLFAYLAIFFYCGWYLFLRPFRNKKDLSFSITEKSVLLGTLSAYLIHNLATFDNLFSYIFLAFILAFINTKVGTVPERLAKLNFQKKPITQISPPVIILMVLSAVYFFHLPAMLAANDLSKGIHASDPLKRLEHYQNAIKRKSFEQKIITQSLAGQSVEIARNPKVSDEIKQKYYSLTEDQLIKLIDLKPGDAEVHYYAGAFYLTNNDLDKAAEQMDLARSYSRNNQSIIHQQGSIALKQGKLELANEYFKTAFELSEGYLTAREYYAASLLHLQNSQDAMALMDSEEVKDWFANSNYLIATSTRYRQTEFLISIFHHRVFAESNQKYRWNNNKYNWLQLAHLYYLDGNKEEAEKVLKLGVEKIAEMKPEAECYISSMEKRRNPQADCSASSSKE